jgi:peptidyl-prolyl cis-trans isomerase SurA
MFFRFSCLVVSSVLCMHSLSSQTLKIAAVVNKDTITHYDLMKRLHFTMATMRIPAEKIQEAQTSLSPQVLRAMIEEKIKLNEAKRYKLTVEKEEILQDWERIEQQNGMPKGALVKQLQEMGLGTQVLEDQIRANIAWVKLVNARYRSLTHISEYEINRRLDFFKNLKDKAHFLVSEIVIRPSGKGKLASEADAFKTAREVVAHLNAGASFATLASQISQSPTAAAGGDMGWVHASHLQKKVKDGSNKTLGDIISQMAIGKVSGPLKTDDGYHIFLLRQKSETLGKNTDSMLTVRSLFHGTSKRISPLERKTIKENMYTHVQKVRGCDQLEKVNIRHVLSPSEEILKSELLESVSPKERINLENLGLGLPSLPIESAKGYTIYMICKIKENKGGLPSRYDIKRELTEEKLQMYERQYIKNLFNSAFIDVRV